MRCQHRRRSKSGSRHDLRVGKSPDAPDQSLFKDDSEGALGYCHSYETSSRYDGPGVRVVLWTSGCLLRCTYCHNPDTWHLKDGCFFSAQQVLDRLASFASAIKTLGGGLTISGGEPMVQLAFTKRIFAVVPDQMALPPPQVSDVGVFGRTGPRWTPVSP